MGGNGSGMEEELEAREPTDGESTAVVADTRSGSSEGENGVTGTWEFAVTANGTFFDTTA